MICLLNRYNLIGMKEEKNLFPIRNYFYFTEIQFNWYNITKHFYLFLMFLLTDITKVKQT